MEELGGLSGLENALKTSINSGLDTHGAANFSVERRQKLFGANKFKEVAQKAFLALFAENLKDPTLVLLMAAALVRCDVAFTSLFSCRLTDLFCMGTICTLL